MEDYYTDMNDNDGGSMLEELRSIGASISGGLILPSLGKEGDEGALGDDGALGDEGALGDDNFNILQRARKSEELKKRHQVDLNDAGQLADLEDAGLQAHMDRARKMLADHERNQAALPGAEELNRKDSAARRALSGLVTGLKAQQMALQVACDDVLLQAANTQKLAEGGRPHGYPVGQAGCSATNLEFLGKKTLAAGEDLAQIVTRLESFERELTLARRAYENAAEGLMRRSHYFERAYREVAALAREGLGTTLSK